MPGIGTNCADDLQSSVEIKIVDELSQAPEIRLLGASRHHRPQLLGHIAKPLPFQVAIQRADRTPVTDDVNISPAIAVVIAPGEREGVSLPGRARIC